MKAACMLHVLILIPLSLHSSRCPSYRMMPPTMGWVSPHKLMQAIKSSTIMSTVQHDLDNFSLRFSYQVTLHYI